MTRRTRSLLLLPAALLLVACGGGDGEGGGSDAGSGKSSGEGSSSEAKPYVDAMVSSLQEGESLDIPEEDARCVAEGMIDVIGIDQVKAAGTPEEFSAGGGTMDMSTVDLDRSQGEEIYSKFGSCGIDLRDMMLEEMAQGGEIPAEQQSCMEDAITDENLQNFFVGAMVDGEAALTDESSSELMSGLMACAMSGLEEPSAN